MFKTHLSKSESLPFKKIVDALKGNAKVDGLLLMGSGGTNDLQPYSDYDLVVILKKLDLPLFSVFTYIEHRMADIYFFSEQELDGILNKEKLDADNMEGKLLNWVSSGTIIFDKSGKLGALKEKGVDVSVEVTQSKKFAAWCGINFNYSHNMRYFSSKEEMYLKALDIRLLYSLAEVISGYFTIRDMPWRGEKAAIKYLREKDSEFLELLDDYNSATNREERVKIYGMLVRKTITPFGEVWTNNFTGVTVRENFSLELLEQGIQFWDELISSAS